MADRSAGNPDEVVTAETKKLRDLAETRGGTYLVQLSRHVAKLHADLIDFVDCHPGLTEEEFCQNPNYRALAAMGQPVSFQAAVLLSGIVRTDRTKKRPLLANKRIRDDYIRWKLQNVEEQVGGRD